LALPFRDGRACRRFLFSGCKLQPAIRTLAILTRVPRQSNLRNAGKGTLLYYDAKNITCHTDPACGHRSIGRHQSAANSHLDRRGKAPRTTRGVGRNSGSAPGVVASDAFGDRVACGGAGGHRDAGYSRHRQRGGFRVGGGGEERRPFGEAGHQRGGSATQGDRGASGTCQGGPGANSQPARAADDFAGGTRHCRSHSQADRGKCAGCSRHH
jgi:hypothetical protein